MTSCGVKWFLYHIVLVCFIIFQVQPGSRIRQGIGWGNAFTRLLDILHVPEMLYIYCERTCESDVWTKEGAAAKLSLHLSSVLSHQFGLNYLPLCLQNRPILKLPSAFICWWVRRFKGATCIINTLFGSFVLHQLGNSVTITPASRPSSAGHTLPWLLNNFPQNSRVASTTMIHHRLECSQWSQVRPSPLRHELLSNVCHSLLYCSRCKVGHDKNARYSVQQCLV